MRAGYRVTMATRTASRTSGREAKRGAARSGRGAVAKRRTRPRAPHFVIQQRANGRVGFALLLEAGGLLRSWGLPRGLSMDPRERRLALGEGEHPRDYGDFEGLIRAQKRGAGPGAVIVWDRGSYRNLTKRGGRVVPIEQALSDGHALVWLEGEKLRGGYALTRVGSIEQEHWLVVKGRDAEADAHRDPVSTAPESVLSGKTIRALLEEAAETPFAGNGRG